MKKIIYRYGIIAGLVVSVMLVGGTNLAASLETTNFDFGQLLGYAGMLIAFSTIFIGIKKHRDKNLDGTISFKKAFGIGLAITFIATVMYVVTWMVISGGPAAEALMETYFQEAVEKAQNSGKTAEAIQTEIDKLNLMKENYSNPFVKILFTLMEIFPVGLIVSLISAFILKKKV